ncbi:MAG: hypothetical protein CFH44_00337 [Proteobacteria bacterium]|nr:MAG: hypothetical protein CFH44_00337 [Pseudomonadota bacterium]|tara:strand:+ start:157 stop:774 length:618 start_codon:yes stop_codon:yes gene_type:complete
MTKEFIIYDTEYWTDEGVMKRNWMGLKDHPPVLIQIGGYKVRADQELSIVDEFICYCKPVDENGNQLPITQYFTDLTNITAETVENEGLPAQEVLNKFKEFAGESNIYSYGRDDYVSLLMSSYVNDFKMPISIKQFSDIRRLLSKAGLEEDVIFSHTSGSLHKYFNANIDGMHVHDARDDALSILVSLREMLKDNKYSLKSEDLV